MIQPILLSKFFCEPVENIAQNLNGDVELTGLVFKLSSFSSLFLVVFHWFQSGIEIKFLYSGVKRPRRKGCTSRLSIVVIVHWCDRNTRIIQWDISMPSPRCASPPTFSSAPARIISSLLAPKWKSAPRRSPYVYYSIMPKTASCRLSFSSIISVAIISIATFRNTGIRCDMQG